MVCRWIVFSTVSEVPRSVVVDFLARKKPSVPRFDATKFNVRVNDNIVYVDVLLL